MGGPAPVRYTEARVADITETIELTGTIESRRTSIVASEVPGVVETLFVRDGDRVDAGAPIARLRRETLALQAEAAAGDLEEARARLELARSSRRRTEDLHEKDLVSEQQLDQAISEEEVARARVRQLEADLERLRGDLGQSTIRAPFAGVVVEEHTQVGEWVPAGGAVVELSDLDDLEVTVEVPERAFGDLEAGADARVVIPSLDGTTVEGEIRTIVPRANPRARTFPVKVSVPNPTGRVGVGLLASVVLSIGDDEEGSVMVPKDALIEQRGSRVVYVIADDGTVRSVGVETGVEAGPWVAVEGDLEPGDRVVTRGNERLEAGQRVEGEVQEYEAP